ncbi:MAG: TMEM175 family protein [Tolumonas sp.]|nr:TMEM175 family protein [Tolumonas sp.]
MNTNRLEAFSDGVMAIAITLLILEIKVPDTTTPLLQGLLSLWPSYFAYSVSFIVIGAIWINHHVMFNLIARIDQKILLLNTLQLLFVSFLPFPTAVLAHALQTNMDESIAAAFYGGVLTIIGALKTIMWFYSVHKKLLHHELSPREARKIGKTYFVGPIGYLLATITAFFNPLISIVLFLSLSIFFLWPKHN